MLASDFKVGDCVVLTKVPTANMYKSRKAYTDLAIGKKGKILCILRDGCLGVEFTTKVFTRPNGIISSADHGCSGRGRKEYSWWVPANCLEIDKNSVEILQCPRYLGEEGTNTEATKPGKDCTDFVITLEKSWIDEMCKSYEAIWGSFAPQHGKIPKDTYYMGVDPATDKPDVLCIKNDEGFNAYTANKDFLSKIPPVTQLMTKELIKEGKIENHLHQFEHLEKDAVFGSVYDRRIGYSATIGRHTLDAIREVMFNKSSNDYYDYYFAKPATSPNCPFEEAAKSIWNRVGCSMYQEGLAAHNDLDKRLDEIARQVKQERAIEKHCDLRIPYIDRANIDSKPYFIKALSGYFATAIDACDPKLNLLLLL